MKTKKWSDYEHLIVTPGTNFSLLVNKLRDEGDISKEDFKAWVRTTPYVPEGFTDEQLDVALASEFVLLRTYGAILIDNGVIRWVG